MTRLVVALALLTSLTLTASKAGAADGSPLPTPLSEGVGELNSRAEHLAQRQQRRRGVPTVAQQAAPPTHTYGSDPWQLADLPVRGPLDATVTIVAFSDFQCPFCERGAQNIDILLANDEFADVRVVFVQYPLAFHEFAHLAAQASLAAHAQGAFWPMHDLMFANQDALTRDDLIAYATQLELDLKPFITALDDEVYAARVDEQMQIAHELGVRGTPSFMINGHFVTGAQPLEIIEPIVRQERALMAELMVKGLTRNQAYAARVQAGREAQAAAEASAEAGPEPDMDQPVYVDPSGRPSQGPADAPIVIVEFGEYQCPFTSRVEDTILELMQEYPTQIQRVWVHFPLAIHQNAAPAALAAIASHEIGLFWQLHEVLIQNPLALSEADIRAHAASAGIDLAFWNPHAPTTAQESRLELDVRTAENLLIRGTPTFLINGRRVLGAQPIEVFREAIDAALLEAQPHLDAGVAPQDIYETVLRDAPSSIRMLD